MLHGLEFSSLALGYFFEPSVDLGLNEGNIESRNIALRRKLVGVLPSVVLHDGQLDIGVVVGRARVSSIEGILTGGKVEGVNELVEGGKTNVSLKVDSVEADEC